MLSRVDPTLNVTVKMVYVKRTDSASGGLRPHSLYPGFSSELHWETSVAYTSYLEPPDSKTRRCPDVNA